MHKMLKAKLIQFKTVKGGDTAGYTLKISGHIYQGINGQTVFRTIGALKSSVRFAINDMYWDFMSDEPIDVEQMYDDFWKDPDITIEKVEYK